MFSDFWVSSVLPVSLWEQSSDFTIIQARCRCCCCCFSSRAFSMSVICQFLGKRRQLDKPSWTWRQKNSIQHWFIIFSSRKEQLPPWWQKQSFIFYFFLSLSICKYQITTLHFRVTLRQNPIWKLVLLITSPPPPLPPLVVPHISPHLFTFGDNLSVFFSPSLHLSSLSFPPVAAFQRQSVSRRFPPCSQPSSLFLSL